MSEATRVSSLPESELLSKFANAAKTGNSDLKDGLRNVRKKMYDLMGTLLKREYPGYMKDQRASTDIFAALEEVEQTIDTVTEQLQVLCFNRTLNEEPDAQTSRDVRRQLLKQIQATHNTQDLTDEQKKHVQLLSAELNTSVEDLERQIFPSVTSQDRFPTCAEEAKALRVRGVVTDQHGASAPSWEFSHGSGYISPGEAKVTITLNK